MLQDLPLGMPDRWIKGPTRGIIRRGQLLRAGNPQKSLEVGDRALPGRSRLRVRSPRFSGLRGMSDVVQAEANSWESQQPQGQQGLTQRWKQKEHYFQRSVQQDGRENASEPLKRTFDVTGEQVPSCPREQARCICVRLTRSSFAARTTL